MSQSHLIAKSFKDVIAADAQLNAALPGNVHYGDSLRPEPGFVRPYALIAVKETGRKYHSGGSAFVDYSVQMTVFGKQEVADVGAIQGMLDTKFSPFVTLPSITGRLIGLVVGEGWLTEDEDEDKGQDVMVATLAWALTILE